MSFPTARNSGGHVDSPRKYGSGVAARAHAEVAGALRCRQPPSRTTGHAAGPIFGAATFRKFLGKLLPHRARGRKMVLIVDNARYHHARLLKPFLSPRRAAVRLDFLPPYSPDLNPIERVWKLARRLATHNQYFPQLQDLIAAVDRQMEAWSAPNPILEKLCCIT